MTNVTNTTLDTEARVWFTGGMNNVAPVPSPSAARFGCVGFASAWLTREGGWAEVNSAEVLQVGLARAAASGPIGTSRWGADLTTWGGDDADQGPRLDAHLALISR